MHAIFGWIQMFLLCLWMPSKRTPLLPLFILMYVYYFLMFWSTCFSIQRFQSFLFMSRPSMSGSYFRVKFLRGRQLSSTYDSDIEWLPSIQTPDFPPPLKEWYPTSSSHHKSFSFGNIIKLHCITLYVQTLFIHFQFAIFHKHVFIICLRKCCMY